MNMLFRRPQLKLGLSLLLPSLLLLTMAHAAEARNFYVSPQGDNSDGLSWKTAFRTIPSLQAPISPVTAGDTVILDGGASGYSYGAQLLVSVSGTAGQPIRIVSSNAPGHNGTVTFSGLVNNGLPNQPTGITLNGSHVYILGAHRGAIKVSDVSFQGIYVSGADNVLNNVEITNVFGPRINPGKIPGVGLTFGGSGHRFYNLDIYGCTQGAVEFATAANPVSASFSRCWFFDNYLRQASGIITQSQNADSRIQLDHCVFGPGLGNAVTAKDSAGAVIVSRSLFINSSRNNILQNAASPSSLKLVVNHATSFMTPSNEQNLAHNCLSYNGNGENHTGNSIFWAGTVDVAANTAIRAAANVQYQTRGNLTALAPTMVDPQFKNQATLSALTGTSALKSFALEDYSVSQSSPAYGKGAGITSIAQINKNVAGYFYP